MPRGLGLSTLREPLSVGAGYAHKLFTAGGHPGGPGAWLLWSPVGYRFSPPLQAFFAVPTISPFPGNPVQPVLTFPAAMAGVDIVIQAATLNLRHRKSASATPSGSSCTDRERSRPDSDRVRESTVGGRAAAIRQQPFNAR